ncbi:hypothetical protein FRB96_004090 [Tulasnella sp. 330]|nr:hypothetical protein FRB96_004090 [Tulasnella sp. 330]
MVSIAKYVYPGTYQYQDFHHTQCGASGGQISNYDDATEVQSCELGGLDDLATETQYVRSRLAQYINDLISLGVDGLRLDASKYIPVADIANILSRTTKKLYITQEVIYGASEPITPNQYTGDGDVQEYVPLSSFIRRHMNAVDNGNIAQLQTVPFSGKSPARANHHTERNAGSLNYLSPNNEYVLAYIYALSFPYGTPTILSSYTFANNDVGAPNGDKYRVPCCYGTCFGTGGVNGFLCQHRIVVTNGAFTTTANAFDGFGIHTEAKIK